MKIMKTVLITGATGSTGKNATKKLLELKIPVRALVHKKDARSEQLNTQGVETVEGDMSDFDSERGPQGDYQCLLRVSGSGSRHPRSHSVLRAGGDR